MYKYKYTDMHVYIHIYTSRIDSADNVEGGVISTKTFIHVLILIRIHVHVHIHICTKTFIHVLILIRIHVHVHIHICIYTYIHIYIYRSDAADNI